MRERLTSWMERHPLFAAALVAAVAVACADSHPALGLAAGGLLALAGGFSGNRGRGLAWLACAEVAVGVFTWRENARVMAERRLLESGGEAAVARILKDARGGNGYWEAPAVLVSGEESSGREGGKRRWKVPW